MYPSAAGPLPDSGLALFPRIPGCRAGTSVEEQAAPPAFVQSRRASYSQEPMLPRGPMSRHPLSLVSAAVQLWEVVPSPGTPAGVVVIFLKPPPHSSLPVARHTLCGPASLP